MSQPVARLLLPFAVPAQDRIKAFTKDMEMATVFYFAESEREKGEQLILKKPVEKIVFIAEACYPMWLVPWRKRTLIFDGFGVTGQKLSYDVLPDVRAFESDIQASAETREAYSASLSNSLNYFQNFSRREEKTIEGLITNTEFIDDLTPYFREAERIKKPIIGKAFLSPSINQSAIAISLEEISDLRKSLEEDIKSLRQSMKELNTTTKEHATAIRKEIRETSKKFDEKIAKVQPVVMKKLQELQKKCDTEITGLSRKYERQLRGLHKDRIKLEKDQQRLDTQIERCEAEMQASKLRKDEGSELQWRQKLQKTKKMLPSIKSGIGEIDETIRKAEVAKKLEIAKIRSHYETSTDEAQKALREIEAAREASIRMRKHEIESLEDATSEIIGQIDKMVELKKAELGKIDGMGFRKKYRNNVLVYIPLYLIAYESKQKRRYVIYPPSVVGSLGIRTKFKGAFGMTRMKSFLQHRSKPLTSFLNQLVTLLREDPVFEKETGDAGIQADIIGTRKARELIKKGLGELRREGWTSENEYKTLSQSLMKE